jgi:hypothetical protein
VTGDDTSSLAQSMPIGTGGGHSIDLRHRAKFQSSMNDYKIQAIALLELFISKQDNEYNIGIEMVFPAGLFYFSFPALKDGAS